jgi:hypothetical protein
MTETGTATTLPPKHRSRVRDARSADAEAVAPKLRRRAVADWLPRRTPAGPPLSVSEVHEDVISSVETFREPEDGWRSWTAAVRARATTRRRIRRGILAAAILMPAVAVTIAIKEPFAIAAIASTVAIVLHTPRRYYQGPQQIASCYAIGIVVSAAISIGGVAVGIPPLVASGVAAVIIIASPAGRIHPPTACIPLQITAHVEPLAMLERWVSFAGLSAGCLAALWLLSTRPLAGYGYTEGDSTETPCTTGPQPC